MQIQDIRRQRLRQLIQERYDDSQARFIDETGENQGEISGLLRTKSFGEKKARNLERKAGLPAGWLDTPQEPTDTASDEHVAAPAAQTQVAQIAAPHLVPLAHIEKGKAALVYVDMTELELLTNYRQATDVGRSSIIIAAEVSEKRFVTVIGNQS
jgi:3,4-dihydroxy 2-butanone 4-phosphate synthase/GTP cyclohydrolase II